MLYSVPLLVLTLYHFIKRLAYTQSVHIVPIRMCSYFFIKKSFILVYLESVHLVSLRKRSSSIT